MLVFKGDLCINGAKPSCWGDVDTRRGGVAILEAREMGATCAEAVTPVGISLGALILRLGLAFLSFSTGGGLALAGGGLLPFLAGLTTLLLEASVVLIFFEVMDGVRCLGLSLERLRSRLLLVERSGLLVLSFVGVTFLPKVW